MDNLEEIMSAITSAAGGPGAPPTGASTFQNPYGFNPLANQAMAPMFQQNATMQMIGSFMPMILGMANPALGARLQQFSNLNSGIADGAKHRQAQQLAASAAATGSQAKMLQFGMSAAGINADTSKMVTDMLPMIGMFAPGMMNAISRFDVTGTGFGFDAAMNSTLRNSAYPASRISSHQVGQLSEQYLESWRRDGKGSLAGMKVLDHETTFGQSISEMLQTRSGLHARGIVGDLFAKTNDIDALRANSDTSKLSAEAARKLQEATTVDELRAVVGSDGLDTARTKIRSANMGQSRGVEEKYAEAMHKAGSVFTELQGNSEGLLQELEKLTGTLDKLTPEKIDDALGRFTKLMDRSGLGATELSKSIDVLQARTGLSDRSVGGEVIARIGETQRNLERSGVGAEAASRIATMSADAVGSSEREYSGLAAGSLLNGAGIAEMRWAADTAADPSATADDRERALQTLRGGVTVGRDGAALVDAGNTQAYTDMMAKAAAGQIDPAAMKVARERTAERIWGEMTPAQRASAQVNTYANAGSGSVRTLIGQALADPATKNRVTTEFDALGIKGDENISDTLVAMSAGSDGIDALIAKNFGDLSADKKKKMREDLLVKSADGSGGVGQAVNAVGTLSDQAKASVLGSLTLGKSSPDQFESDAEYVRKVKDLGYDPSNARTAFQSFLEKKEKGVQDAFAAVAGGMGVLAPDSKLSPAQLEALERSSFGKDLDAAKDEKDAEKQKKLYASALGNMTEALRVGGPDAVKQILNSGDTPGAESLKKVLNGYGKGGESAETAPKPESPAPAQGSASSSTKDEGKREITITLVLPKGVSAITPSGMNGVILKQVQGE